MLFPHTPYPYIRDVHNSRQIRYTDLCDDMTLYDISSAHSLLLIVVLINIHVALLCT